MIPRPNRKTSKRAINVGECEICGVVYTSEKMSILHILGKSHHITYERVQRELKSPISHFCALCGVGGFPDMDSWDRHVASGRHRANYKKLLYKSKPAGGQRQRSSSFLECMNVNENSNDRSSVRSKSSVSFRKSTPIRMRLDLDENESTKGLSSHDSIGNNMSENPSSQTVSSSTRRNPFAIKDGRRRGSRSSLPPALTPCSTYSNSSAYQETTRSPERQNNDDPGDRTAASSSNGGRNRYSPDVASRKIDNPSSSISQDPSRDHKRSLPPDQRSSRSPTRSENPQNALSPERLISGRESAEVGSMDSRSPDAITSSKRRLTRNYRSVPRHSNRSEWGSYSCERSDNGSAARPFADDWRPYPQDMPTPRRFHPPDISRPKPLFHAYEGHPVPPGPHPGLLPTPNGFWGPPPTVYNPYSYVRGHANLNSSPLLSNPPPSLPPTQSTTLEKHSSQQGDSSNSDKGQHSCGTEAPTPSTLKPEEPETPVSTQRHQQQTRVVTEAARVVALPKKVAQPSELAISMPRPMQSVEKMHEISQISEAIDQIKQEQSRITNLIRQLNEIRQANIEKMRNLRLRRSNLLREMNQSDSQTDTSSEGGLDNIPQVRSQSVETQTTAVEEKPQVNATSPALIGSTYHKSLNVPKPINETVEKSPATIHIDLYETSIEENTSESQPEDSESRSKEQNEVGLNKRTPVLGRKTGLKHKPNILKSQASKRKSKPKDSTPPSKRRKTAPTVEAYVIEKADAGAATAAPAANTEEVVSYVDTEQLQRVRRIINHPKSKEITFAELDKLEQLVASKKKKK